MDHHRHRAIAHDLCHGPCHDLCHDHDLCHGLYHDHDLCHGLCPCLHQNQARHLLMTMFPRKRKMMSIYRTFVQHNVLVSVSVSVLLSTSILKFVQHLHFDLCLPFV